MIKLRRLAAFNLATTYARMLEDNKIRHYCTTYAKSISDPKTADEMVIEYVAKETGDTVEIEQSRISNTYGIDIKGVQIAKDVLESLPQVKKQLEKQEIKSLLFQYNRSDSWWKYLLNPIAIPYNWIVCKINTKWADCQWKKLGGYPKSKLGEDGLFALRDQIKSIPLLPIAEWRRYVTPCHYLTVTFDESNRAEAIKILQKDLQILGDNKLIIGHLAMPFQIQLADTTGSGELSYVLACFLFVDDFKIEKLIGKSKYDEVRYSNNKPALNLVLGLKTESFEGTLSNADIRKKYEIETIDIFKDEYKENQNTYIKSWVEQQEEIKRLIEEEKKWIENNKK